MTTSTPSPATTTPAPQSLSYSAVETYRSCPLKYKFAYIDKITEGPKSGAQLLGSAVHRALQFAHKGENVFLPTNEEVLHYFAQQWTPEFWASEEEAQRAFQKGIAMLTRYLTTVDRAAVTPIALESPFRFTIGPAQRPLTITGIIDRIDKIEGGYEIIDYKTGQRACTQEEADANLQLTIYARALLERYPKIAPEQITLSLYYVASGEKISSRRTAADLEAMERDLLALRDDITHSTFPPRVSGLCDYCPFQRLCPMQKHKFADLYTEEAIRAAVDELFTIAQRQKRDRQRAAELKQQIQTFLREHDLGRAFGRTGVVTRSHRRTEQWDAAMLTTLLQKTPYWTRVATADPKKVTALLEDLPDDLRTAIAAARTARETESLTVKRRTDVQADTDTPPPSAP